MSNERSGRNPTDWMGIAAVIALIIIWQLLELIKALLIVGAVFALGWGSYWIWSKIQAQKNQQRYLNNFYDNLHHGNTNQSGNYPNNLNQYHTNQLPPNQQQTYSNPSQDPNFQDFQEYQKFRDWQRHKQQSNNSTNNQQQNYNPYSDSYEG